MSYISHQEVKVLDVNSIWHGTEVEELMENAGRAVAEEVSKRVKEGELLVVCGTGNNGGDGLVAARYLAKAGYKVRVFLLGKEMKSRASRKNLERLRISGILVEASPEPERLEVWEEVVVDALLGTGIEGELREPYRTAVEKIKNSKAYKVAVDLPSGMDNRGEGFFAKPDFVVTFVAPKIGLESFNTVVRDIGIPERAKSHAGPGEVAVSLKKRDKDAHKGDFGRVLVVGGSEDFHGAPLLSAMGSYASGCDLVYLIVPEDILTPARCFAPEFIVIGYSAKNLKAESIKEAENFIHKADTAVIGPGLGERDETLRAVVKFLEEWEKPVVVDADALKAVALAGRVLEGKRAIVTPHAGELRMLAGKEFEDRELAAREVAESLSSIVLLKGSTDVIASPDGRVKLNDTGNSGMTAGGTGDVLAGIAAGFLAQDAEPFYAACASAFINGYAGDCLARKKGYLFSSSELAKEVPLAIKEVFSRVGWRF